MAVTAIIGTGSSYSYSGVTYKVLRMSIDGISREFVEADKMDTTTWQEKLPKSLADPGTVTMDIEADGTLPTMSTTAATLTITFSNSTARSVSGYLASVSNEIPLEDKTTGTITWQCTGAWS